MLSKKKSELLYLEVYFKEAKPGWNILDKMMDIVSLAKIHVESVIYVYVKIRNLVINPYSYYFNNGWYK